MSTNKKFDSVTADPHHQDHAPDNSSNQPFESALRVILVETETPGNLGASARAMKSMGLTNLRLVKPHRRNSGEALARAMSARDVLNHAQEFSSLAEAIADCDLVIATSGKIKTLDLPRYTPRQAAKLLWDFERVHQSQDSTDISKSPAVVFGRESRGLTRSEVSLCHGYITIPTHPDCPSLNLASALQVIAYRTPTTLIKPIDISVFGGVNSVINRSLEIDRKAKSNINRSR